MLIDMLKEVNILNVFKVIIVILLFFSMGASLELNDTIRKVFRIVWYVCCFLILILS